MQERAKNIFLEIEYFGKNYFGFQAQAKKTNQPTIQEVLESSLFKLFQEKIRIRSSGRTDRGVHAKSHPLNFIVKTKIPLANLQKALNSFLPSDIRVKKAKKVPLDFQAQFWAKSKTYCYIILNQREPSVFWHDFSWHFPKELNFNHMHALAGKITGKRDFSFFAKDSGKYKHCVRDLKKIVIKKKGKFIFIYLEANGFLRQMARNIVFFLTEAGIGKIKTEDIGMIFSGKKKFIKKPAPPQGLYLYQVKY